MTPEERARLRELAEAATPDEAMRFGPDWVLATSPAVVLSLLDALDEAEILQDIPRVERDEARLFMSEWAARAGRAEGALEVREAQRAAALKLHVREVIAVHESGPEAWCATCMDHWPCATARALGVES